MARLGCILLVRASSVFEVIFMMTSPKAAVAFTERFLQDLPPYEVVHPVSVDARGHFLSNSLSQHTRRVRRREASEITIDTDRVFYQFLHDSHRLHFNLTLNPNLLAPGFLTERRYGGLDGAKIHHPRISQCHFLGEVWDDTTVQGSAAISTCDGLVSGSFGLPSDSRHSLEESERRRARWEHRRHRRRIRQRSVSKEKWVETLVVADPKMVDYHGSKAVENYVLAVMNIVAGLYKDASIGNAINIVIVRLILLEQDEDDLKITHHADNSLNSFCKWQKKLNMKGDDHPLHHDVAVLLTRKDICAAVNTPCETLGLSHVAGLCQPHRSCSISEDTGLPMAFTVAHEMGHNFGIQHDGNGNDCEPVGKGPFVMSPQLLYGTFLPRWSRCSRQYITRFLDQGWGWCLDDVPVKDKLSLTSLLPGVLYSAVHQCRLQYGSWSRLCNDMDNVCSTLWCTVGATCHSKLDGAVDGTSCGENKWCISGDCVPVGFHPESVDGGWASWSEWSACSRTCGAGVQTARRDCDNPTPKHRGKYCLGERQKHRICNTTPCPHGEPSFRNVQCSHFNSLPYKDKFYKWEAVISKVNPCELHCRPLNEQFSEKMRDAVVDGTPCYEGNKSRNMCINGICQNIGCDYMINSNSVEDRCGVCNGNNSTCKTVRRTFQESEGIGYVDIGLIPEGAWDILIEEVAEAGNFLALRSDNPSKYFLNGGWTIQWNGEYKAAGTVFTYERTGQLENLTSPGPTVETLWIQLLFQETNPGVRYEYTIRRNVSEDKNTPSPVYFWKYGSWSECSVTCGTGVQRQTVYCVEKMTGLAEERLCDPSTRPDDNHTSCTKDPCPATWWVGDWQKCSASCGSLGLAKRIVLCIQAVSADRQKALHPSNCEHLPKPESISACNTHTPCQADWVTGSWSMCSQTCGTGFRYRNVTCSNTSVDCDPQNKPFAVTACHIQVCTQLVDHFGGIEWSGSGWSSNDVLNEINPIPEVKPPPKYSTTRSQPRTSNDWNNIDEGDFHYRNIENNEHPQEISVPVDDFYYDYNFINFHEDLSFDFESNEERSESSHGFGSQEAKPTEKEKSPVGSTSAPTANRTVLKVDTLATEEPQIIKTDNSSEELYEENLDDFLSEDRLLPVSPTRPSPKSTTQHSQTEKDRNWWWPENPRALPNLLFTAEQPALDETWGQSGEEENHSEHLTVTLTHGAPTPRHQTTAGATTVNFLEAVHDYISAEQDDGENSGPLGSLFPETVTQVRTELDESEIPQTTSVSTYLPVAVTMEDWDLDSNNLATSDSTFWYTSFDLSTTLPSSPEESSPPPTSPSAPFLLISGNVDMSDSLSLTGTEVRPDPNLQGATMILPADSQTATMDFTYPALPETTGTNPTSQPPLFHSTDFDYNEILIPSREVESKINSQPNLSKVTSVTPKLSSAQAKHMNSPSPAAPFFPTHGESFGTISVENSASPQVSGAAFWIAGNWSTCSTSCGLGAVWRTLTCSTGSESNCDPTKKPAPARQCYLRPCSMWKLGEWSACSKNCEGGIKFREVQCFDLRDERPLRPFHCRAMSTRPPTQKPCNVRICLDWYSSSWGQCSEVCGGGEQQRIVTCPEDNRCDEALQPSSIQPCNIQPCAQWLTGSWGQCSASCGGGMQQRLIKCVDTKVETEEEVEQIQCDHELKPKSTQKCHLQDCESTSPGTVCVHDRLTVRLCQTLRSLGRCQLPTVQAKCCKTCRALAGVTSPHR
ncbi:A disintegrin and metalloproteinase with thrombospondin motifs 7 [Nematolebias whitei]|uniref:A disintegrin and metalloproteinase with thrombospondin motifs 7 n=1 Tax=Nematolebias whitei TaxID=451745 RepID=UPI00189913C4|nr:A disintegrin and metalloproteinase with thrombospondin motifs 7 [Nematolebias whitei]